MAFLTYEGVGITAMAAAVPRCVVDNYKYTQYFPEDQVKEVVDKIGIYERRFADADTCSSDLCFAAAERLIEDNGINKEEIDLLVFISQTPDYRMPATSVILQDRLKLSHSCVAFDISLGCSAFWMERLVQRFTRPRIVGVRSCLETVGWLPWWSEMRSLGKVISH